MLQTLNPPFLSERAAAEQPRQSRSVGLGVLRWVARTVPSVVAFSALGGLLVWGHSTGWTVPKFSALAGEDEAAGDDWCEDHGVPESACVECNPDLMPRAESFGWCKRHGVHECPLCHPEIAQTDKPARVTAADLDRANTALAFTDRPENDSRCPLHGRRIQFVSADAADRAGVKVEPVWTGPVVESVVGPGEVNYDQTLTARLSARVPGSVYWAVKKVGDRVAKGEVVALVDAAEVGRAKADLFQAVVQLRLRKRVFDNLRDAGGAVPQRTMTEAETGLAEAQIRLTSAQQALTNLGLPVDTAALQTVPDNQLADRLRFVGLPAAVADSFDPRTTTGNLLPVVAPFDGVVAARDVVAGEVVDAAKVLFVVVDTGRMWLTLDLRLEDVRPVVLGQTVRFRPDGAKAEAVGTVAWVSTEADHRTRSVKVRAVVPNPDGKLRANTFGAGRVVLREEPGAVVVPNEAIHSDGQCNIVFVRDKAFLGPDGPKVFYPRSVRVGARGDRQTEVVAGVLPGELVVTKGGESLRAELLRGNLGEGCACHKH